MANRLDAWSIYCTLKSKGKSHGPMIKVGGLDISLLGIYAMQNPLRYLDEMPFLSLPSQR